MSRNHLLLLLFLWKARELTDIESLEPKRNPHPPPSLLIFQSMSSEWLCEDCQQLSCHHHHCSAATWRTARHGGASTTTSTALAELQATDHYSVAASSLRQTAHTQTAYTHTDSTHTHRDTSHTHTHTGARTKKEVEQKKKKNKKTSGITFFFILVDWNLFSYQHQGEAEPNERLTGYPTLQQPELSSPDVESLISLLGWTLLGGDAVICDVALCSYFIFNLRFCAAQVRRKETLVIFLYFYSIFFTLETTDQTCQIFCGVNVIWRRAISL